MDGFQKLVRLRDVAADQVNAIVPTAPRRQETEIGDGVGKARAIGREGRSRRGGQGSEREVRQVGRGQRRGERQHGHVIARIDVAYGAVGIRRHGNREAAGSCRTSRQGKTQALIFRAIGRQRRRRLTAAEDRIARGVLNDHRVAPTAGRCRAEVSVGPVYRQAPARLQAARRTDRKSGDLQVDERNDGDHDTCGR